ncbi:MAG: YggT family protein [Clostridiaceae bacterium]|jgi:YggT family protein|nr:YggT family protein [Clostridiaceae bacterium]
MAAKLKMAVSIFIRVTEGLILLRLIFMFVFVPKENKLKQFVISVTEPVLAPIRKMFASSSLGKDLRIDISPFLAFLVFGIIEYAIIQLIALLS